jgi:diguanylate cyclase (GGDEF)-like protein/PAS domain S-box-containing protein
MLEQLKSIQWRSWMIITLQVVLLFLIGGMLVMLPFHNNLTNLFWPPAGFCFVAFWWFGKRAMAGVVTGVLLVNISILSIHHPGHVVPMAFFDALEALMVVWWLRRQGITDIFADAESILKFILIGVMVGPGFNAALGVISLWFNGLLKFSTAPETLLAWWIGDGMGVLLVVPFLLSLSHFRKHLPSAARLLEFAGVGILLVWLWFNLFMAPPALNLPPLSFMAIPLIIWVAVRFSTGVLASVLFAISLFAIYGTSLGNGPFVRENLQESIAYLYGFLGMLSSIGLFLGVTIAHSRRSMYDLAREHLALQVSEEGLRTTLENTPNVAVQWYDMSGRVLYWNTASELLYGWSSDQALGKMPDQLIYAPEEAQRFRACMDEIARTGKVVGPFESRIRHRDGQIVNVLSTMFSMPEAEDNTRRLVCMDVDITERKRAEISLRESEVRFRTVIEQSPIGIAFSREGITVEVNDVYLHMFGYNDAAEVHGLPLINHIAPQCRPEVEDRIRRRIKGEQVEASYETIGLRKDGSQFPIYISAKRIVLNDGPLTFAFLIDITQRKKSEERINHLAFYDHLTDLPNRLSFMDRLQQALAFSKRSGKAGALLLIDLDNFKALNDTLGHDIGDLLLQKVAQRLTDCVREGDTVARLGGDEFVVMLEDLNEDDFGAAAQTETVAEKILAALNRPYQLGAHEHHSTASIGATLFIDYSQPIENLFKQADIAMYQAKKAGRNTLRFFDPQMQEIMHARATLENDLHKALEHFQFQLHYQIQVDGSLHPLGAEALIRWNHPERGWVSPAQFIPLAEDTGLILPIGQLVLDNACAQLKSWAQKESTQDLVLAVNVSASQFGQPGFVEQIKAAVQHHAINPALLKLEMTESMLLANIKEIIVKMHLLKEVGVQFSLDDFGTGYSSLQYLKQLPLDQLKIDQSFVRDIMTNSSDKAIVRTIIAMAQSLNLDIIAEGVETEEQRQLLLSNGCNHFQGYLFGKPKPVEEFEASLKFA